MRIRRFPVLAAIATAGVLFLGGCASGAQTSAIGPASGSVPSVAGGMPPATVVMTPALQEVATPSLVHIPAPRPAPSGGVTSPGSTPVCRTSTLIIVDPPSDNPLRSACLHMGVDARITLNAGNGWVRSPVSSSDPAVVAVTETVGPDGAHQVTVHPLRPGTTTLSSALNFTPDPHGPATMSWMLTLTIAP